MTHEVKATIKKEKERKGTEPDNIEVEQLEALEEFSIVKITNIFNEIYDTGHIPKNG